MKDHLDQASGAQKGLPILDKSKEGKGGRGDQRAIQLSPLCLTPETISIQRGKTLSSFGGFSSQ